MATSVFSGNGARGYRFLSSSFLSLSSSSSSSFHSCVHSAICMACAREERRLDTQPIKTDTQRTVGHTLGGMQGRVMEDPSTSQGGSEWWEEEEEEEEGWWREGRGGKAIPWKCTARVLSPTCTRLSSPYEPPRRPVRVLGRKGDVT